jgi:mono/diheme cytochrome c family protein
MRDRSQVLLVALACLPIWVADASGDKLSRDLGRYGAGRPATEKEIQNWNIKIDVASGGEGVPPGRGTVKRGAQIFAVACAQCHGPSGVEGPVPHWQEDAETKSHPSLF